MSLQAQERYRNIGYSTLPFENTSENWMLVIGAQFTSAIGTLGANSQNIVLEVEDAQENILDTIVIVGTSYAASPVTGGTVYFLFLPKKLLVPPGGSVNAISAVTSIQIIEAVKTLDGRSSLENAMLTI